jgi:uncharacterized protein YwgA
MIEEKTKLPMSSDQLALLETEKVLVLAQETGRRRIQFDEEDANSFVFLLKQDFEVPFLYRFTFNPMPYSEELIDDIETLSKAGYLQTSSPISLEEKGRRWIEQNQERFRPFTSILSKALDRFGGFDKALLRRHAYNVATARL